MTHDSPALSRLIEAADSLLGRGGRNAADPLPPSTSDGLERALRAALAAPDLLPPGVESRPPEGFAAYKLHGGDSFALVCTVTAPGVSLPIHDHGCWGLVGVYRGVEEEVTYVPRDDTPRGDAPPGGVDGGAGLVEVARRVHEPGDVMVIEPPPRDVHLVASRGAVPSVCIHLLGHDVVAEGFNVFSRPDQAPQPTGPLRYQPVPVTTRG